MHCYCVLVLVRRITDHGAARLLCLARGAARAIARAVHARAQARMIHRGESIFKICQYNLVD
eukprot:SAG31_NODE_22200_length_531_cov_1.537037_1_plen_61_part_10